jgi:hypothetical protein
MRKFPAGISFHSLICFRRSLLADDPELVAELLGVQQEILGKRDLITHHRRFKAGRRVGGN